MEAERRSVAGKGGKAGHGRRSSSLESDVDEGRQAAEKGGQMAQEGRDTSSGDEGAVRESRRGRRGER